MIVEYSFRRGFSAFAVVVALLSAASAGAGTIVEREFRSNALDRDWKYTVYLPNGYESADLRYPVLYLLHGNGGSRLSWIIDGRIQQTTDALIARGDIPSCLIVMPDAGTTWYVNRKEAMESAIMEDLIPEIERQWKAQTGRDGRLIGGLSMGGYGALRFAMKYPERFAAAALLSPAIYDPEPPESSSARRVGVFGATDYDGAVWRSLNYPMLWNAFLSKKTPVPMYINSGDDDDFFIESEATRLYSLLRRNKQPAELRIVNGAHVWPVWESTVGDAMTYIFRYAARPAISAAR